MFALSRLTRREVLKACLAAPCLGLPAVPALAAPLQSKSSGPALDGNFTGGCCVFEGIREGALVCRPNAPATATGGLWYWFTARLTGAKGRQTIELHWPPDNAEAKSKSEYGNNKNFATALDRALNVSADLRRWTPIEGVQLNGQVVRFTVDAGEGSAPLYIAACLPYFKHELEDIISECRASSLARLTVIARTQAGHPVHAVRIGPAGRGLPAFHLQGYQHGTEWAGARILSSMLRHLLSEAGRPLRERFVFHIIPAMNVDHLYTGKGPTGNMNRDWENFTMAETAGVREYIKNYTATGDRLLHALDLHMGWASPNSSGASITAGRKGALPDVIIARQEAFAHHAFARCDWTKDTIWRPQHTNGISFAVWAAKTLGVAAQTAEFSRHMIWERARGQWARVTQAHEDRLGIDLAEALGSFDWK